MGAWEDGAACAGVEVCSDECEGWALKEGET